ncbi:MAG: hypothetical protein QXI25_03960, partial [Candidatus Caldarchaeum sp.]
ERIERGEAELSESLEKSLSLYRELLKTCLNRIDEISSLLASAVVEMQTKAVKVGVKSYRKPRQTYK